MTSLLFQPVTQDGVVHDIATADAPPTIEIIGLGIKPLVGHETTALCALHGWQPPLGISSLTEFETNISTFSE